MSEELERLRAENARLLQQQQQQHGQQQQRESMMSIHSPGVDSTASQLDFIHAQQELSRCKETLIGRFTHSTFTFLLVGNMSP